MPRKAILQQHYLILPELLLRLRELHRPRLHGLHLLHSQPRRQRQHDPNKQNLLMRLLDGLRPTRELHPRHHQLQLPDGLSHNVHPHLPADVLHNLHQGHALLHLPLTRRLPINLPHRVHQPAIPTAAADLPRKAVLVQLHVDRKDLRGDGQRHFVYFQRE